MRLVLLKRIDLDDRTSDVYVNPNAVNYIRPARTGTVLVLDTDTMHVVEEVLEVRKLLEDYS